MPKNLSPRTALILFITLVTFLFAQAVWWIMLMARLIDEKVGLAEQFGASPETVERIQQEEISRQIMVGFEGVFFLLVFLVGVWLIYRTLVRTEELKFHQQNFLMAVTHELKTPLASINIYLDTLQSEKIADVKKQTILPRMKDDIRRLGRLVENILEAGRFDRHGYRLNTESFDLTELLEQRLNAVSKTPTKVPLTIEKELEPGIECVGDQKALSQAIDAILENSLKYHNSVKTEIKVRLTAAKDRIKLVVEDNGIGLEKKSLKAVFERFYRVGDEMTREASGTGLGLYLCREIVKAHGGDVTAESDGLGHGTRFIVRLRRRSGLENNSAG